MIRSAKIRCFPGKGVPKVSDKAIQFDCDLMGTIISGITEISQTQAEAVCAKHLHAFLMATGGWWSTADRVFEDQLFRNPEVEELPFASAFQCRLDVTLLTHSVLTRVLRESSRGEPHGLRLGQIQEKLGELFLLLRHTAVFPPIVKRVGQEPSR